MSLGPSREEVDKSGSPCTVFDIVFHPNALAEAKRNRPYRDMLVEISISHLRDRMGVDVGNGMFNFSP